MDSVEYKEKEHSDFFKATDEQDLNDGKKNAPKESFIKELIKMAIVAIIIVVPIRVYIAQPFIVSGSSMEPTFTPGNYLIVDEISYRKKEPTRFEVVVFRFPEDKNRFLIKRIIGLPGETVQITSGVVRIINAEHPESMVLKEPYVVFPTKETLAVTLKDNEYFVLGDNRQNSSDSRIWGPLEKDLIVGRVFVRLFPPNRMGLFPGSIEKISSSTIPENASGVE